MIKAYVGGYDSNRNYVRMWMNDSNKKCYIYDSYEEAAKNIVYDSDADAEEDDMIWFVEDDGSIYEFTDWYSTDINNPYYFN